ncbi:MAG: proprotein convertase P-domain-containing protein, partial [Saprospiraceae bacterium]
MNTNRLSQRCISYALKAGWSLAFLLLTLTWVNAQTFNGNTNNTAGNNLIPSVGTGGCAVEPQTIATGGTTFNNTVAGLAATQVVSKITINLTHTWDGDLSIHLQAPNGQVIALSLNNGGSNDNYTNTVFMDGSPNITTGAPPFTGTFAPQGGLTATTCGATITPTVTTLSAFTQGQNGVWQLRILDNAGGDTGAMTAWSITFVPAALPCQLNTPANITVASAAGFCASSPTVNLPSTNPAGCANGTNTGIQYSVNGGPFMQVAGLPGATSVVIPNLPVGTNTIIWQTYSIPGNAIISTVTQIITVADTQAPIIVCPGNVNVTLDPGACAANINYVVTASDNCTFQGPSTTSQIHGDAASNQNNFATITFGVQNTGPTPIKITGVNANLGDFPGPAFTGSVQTRLLFGPLNGAGGLTGTADITAWTPTPAQAISVNVTQYFQTTFVPIPVASQFTLLPGQSRGIAVQSTGGNFMRYANGDQTTTNGTLTIISNGHFAGGAVNVLGNSPRLFKGSVQYALFLASIPVTQNSGLPSGSEFPIGTTNNCFTATDAAGNSATCCFSVTVNGFPNPSTTLACNDNVQVSVDDQCEAFVSTSMILSGDVYGCYDNYLVTIQGFGSGLGGVQINSSAVGQTLNVTVSDPTTGNSCWGTISVEDKLPPTIECRAVTVLCGEALPTVPAPELSGYQNLLYTGL